MSSATASISARSSWSASSWQLRDNLTAYDACYIALAETLGCSLLTADARLSRAPGTRCAIETI